MADPRFHTTKWSMILSARARGEPGSAEALARLCEAYWFPLYAFARRMGRSPDDARDLTQGYFLQLLERDWLDDVRKEAGKFRSFLLASMKHYMANVRRDAAAAKRGGGVEPLSLDFEAAEHRYRSEPADDRTPDKAYERQWAFAVIEQAHARLRAQFEESGQLERHAVLAPYLSGDGGLSYREAAERLGTTEAAVKMTVSRMRKRFGMILRELIAETVERSEEIDDEVRHLLSIVR